MKFLIFMTVLLLLAGYMIVKISHLDLDTADDRESFAGKAVILVKDIKEDTAKIVGKVVQSGEKYINESNRTMETQNSDGKQG